MGKILSFMSSEDMDNFRHDVKTPANSLYSIGQQISESLGSDYLDIFTELKEIYQKSASINDIMSNGNEYLKERTTVVHFLFQKIEKIFNSISNPEYHNIVLNTIIPGWNLNLFSQSIEKGLKLTASDSNDIKPVMVKKTIQDYWNTLNTNGVNLDLSSIDENLEVMFYNPNFKTRVIDNMLKNLKEHIVTNQTQNT